MRRFFSALAVVKFLAVVSAMAAAPLWASGAVPVPDEIIVKYKSFNRFADHGKMLRRVNRQTEVIRHERGRFEAVGVDRWAALREKIKTIKKDPNVLYAEPNYYGRFAETVPLPPSDPSYVSQWWLPAVGDRTMWALGRGSGVIVAVIDTGADLTHPDLVANLLTNGYNFGDGNATPQDQLGHGTRVSGIIAASQNNDLGVSGLAPEAKILPIKINPGAEGTFTSDRLATAIDYAVSNGAKVINLSLTVDQETQTVRDALQAALNAGVVIVAAAGNTDGCGSAGPVQFPGNMVGVIGVAATDEKGELASFSCRGPEVTVAAPGENVVSTLLGGQYGSGAPGTSFSAPIVAAAVADMISINPALPASGFARYLRENTNAISGGTYAYGVVDAGKTGNSLVPHLVLSKQQFSSLESLPVNYTLPPTGGAVDIYVAVMTPAGEYALHPNGQWTTVAASGYVPFALGYSSTATSSGTLFGSGGIFSAISLTNLPGGTYTWRTALVGSASGKVVGDVITTTMSLGY